MKKLDGKSLDIVSENIEKLKELFPEVFEEGKIDFEKLQNELGKFVDKENERYNFTWNGKIEAKKIAQTPSTGTLRPVKEESKNWDATQNLYIEGDNLEVLKLLQKSYHKKVKMIYIDPPYNTGKDFVYKDNFKDNVKNYLELTGQVDSEGNRLSLNSETNGRYHSDWLSMMYPRLKLARNLLKDDGVIFISIDDNEVANLRKLCDEIFGEDNFVAQLVWQSKSGGSQDEKHIVKETEYIFVFSKNKSKVKFGREEIDNSHKYKLSDDYQHERGNYLLKKLDFRMTSSHFTELLNYPIKTPDGTDLWPGGLDTKSEGGWNWRWSKEKVKWGFENNFLEFKKNKGQWVLNSKQYEKVDNNNQLIDRNYPYRNLIKSSEFNTTQGSSEVVLEFGSKIFEYAKPSKFLMFLCKIANLKDDDITLDFFSGSATTAHAVMQLNAEDGGERKYICVQLPELTDEKSEAYKAGYKNICEIGKERIRRAGEKIIADNPDKDLSNLDIGFKVFKLDSSNIKEWDSDFDNLEQNLLDATQNIKEDRSSKDLLYEILLKYGLDLTLPIEEKILEGKKVFIIGYGALVVCLDNDITTDIVEAIAKLKDEYETETMRVVFKDSSFKDAVVKTNAIQILKQYGIDEVVSV